MIKRNLTLFEIDSFLAGFWPLSAVAVIYFESITRSYTEAMLIFAMMNLAQGLFEIPTGVVSDKIGRKYSMVGSCLLILAGYLMWAAAGDMQCSFLLYAGAMFIGCGQAFISGTDDAFVYETVKELGQPRNFAKVFSANKSFGELGLALSAVLATVVFYFSSLNVLAWISVIPPFLRAVAAFFYVEPQCVNRPQENPWKHFVRSLMLLRRRPKLIRLALVKSFNYSFNAANWRFAGAYYEQLITPWLINAVRVLQELMGFVGFRLVRLFHRYEAGKILFFSVLGNALVKLFAVILNTTATPFIMAAATLGHGLSLTMENSLLQKQFTDRQRATMGSVVSLLAGLLSVFIFALTGWFADQTSARSAVLALVLWRIAIAFAYKHILNK